MAFAAGSWKNAGVVSSSMEGPVQRGLARRASRRPGVVVWMFGLDKPGLTERRQLWGIVPTFRFWNRLDTARHQAPLMLAGVGLILAVHLLCTMPLLLAVGPLLTLMIIVPAYAALGMLPLGLFERWLRREIVRRRGGGAP